MFFIPSPPPVFHLSWGLGLLGVRILGLLELSADPGSPGALGAPGPEAPADLRSPGATGVAGPPGADRVPGMLPEPQELGGLLQLLVC